MNVAPSSGRKKESIKSFEKESRGLTSLPAPEILVNTIPQTKGQTLHGSYILIQMLMW